MKLFHVCVIFLITANSALISYGAEPIKENSEINKEKESANINQRHRKSWNAFDEYFNDFDLRINQLSDDMNKNVIYSFSNKMPFGTVRPNIDISSSEEHYLIKVEVPGIDEEDLKVQINDNTLIIAFEKQREIEEKNKDSNLSEHSYSSFKKVLTLPKDANRDNIHAKIKNGLLTITMPRKEVAMEEVRTIKIEKG